MEYKKSAEKIMLDRQMNLIIDNRKRFLMPLFRHIGKSYWYKVIKPKIEEKLK